MTTWNQKLKASFYTTWNLYFPISFKCEITYSRHLNWRLIANCWCSFIYMLTLEFGKQLIHQATVYHFFFIGNIKDIATVYMVILFYCLHLFVEWWNWIYCNLASISEATWIMLVNLYIHMKSHILS